VRASVLSVALFAAGCADRVDVGMAPPPLPPPVSVGASEVITLAVPPTAPPDAAPRVYDLGRSHAGRPLTLVVFGTAPQTVFIFGGIHGSEPTSASLAAAFADYLAENPELYASVSVAILAAANPDGLAAGTRQNAVGVDLNRNFPARNWLPARQPGGHGDEPASEPETRAILRAVELLNPMRVLALHSINRARACNNYDGPAARCAQALSQANGYPVRGSIGYPTPGSFGSWAAERRLPTVTLELPREADAAEVWRDNRAALLAFVRGAAE
jgi:murein peptide amidase A